MFRTRFELYIYEIIYELDSICKHVSQQQTKARQANCCSLLNKRKKRGKLNAFLIHQLCPSSALQHALLHFMQVAALQQPRPRRLRWSDVWRLRRECRPLLRQARFHQPLLLQQLQLGHQVMPQTRPPLQTVAQLLREEQEESRTRTGEEAARWNICMNGVRNGQHIIKETHNVSKNKGDASSQRC